MIPWPTKGFASYACMDIDRMEILSSQKLVRICSQWKWSFQKALCKKVWCFLGAFRKHLQKHAEFVFLTAPHCVQTVNGETSKEGNTIHRIEDSDTSTETIENDDDSRSWWFNSDDRTFKGTNKNGPAYGFDDSIRAVEQAWVGIKEKKLG